MSKTNSVIHNNTFCYTEPMLDETDDKYVECDEDCRALTDPQTAEEIKAAYEHWRGHGYLNGCSHGN